MNNKGQCLLGYVWGLLSWYIIPFGIFFLLILLVAQKNKKKADEIYKRSWANQEEMIALLKEIRDTLKK